MEFPRPLEQLIELLELEVRKPELFRAALTHRSFLNETDEEFSQHNERLELIGDAVIELVVKEYLYDQHPDFPEGKITELVACLVNNEQLGAIGLSLKLGEFLRMSRGEERQGGRTNLYLNACALEALMGAIYKDGGLGQARLYIDHYILKVLRDLLKGGVTKGAKSSLQEETQRLWGVAPRYEVTDQTGPAHLPVFTVVVTVNGRVLGSGTGPSQKKAESAAALQALQQHFNQ